MSQIIYVKQDATGNNDGSSWEHAFKTLDKALEIVNNKNTAVPLDNPNPDCDVILIAKGTYYPSTTYKDYYKDYGQDRMLEYNEERSKTFLIKNTSVKIYGGFIGDEQVEEAIPTLANYTQLLKDRDLENNTTTLSGDLKQDDDDTNKAFHVVTHIADKNIEDDNQTYYCLLNGLIIQDGYANGEMKSGGGIYSNSYNSSSNSLVIEHSTIQNNTASGNGGGIYSNSNSYYYHSSYTSSNSLVIEHSTIQNNTASGNGGGIYSNSSNSYQCYDTSNSLVIEHSTIQNNAASDNGGGIYSSHDYSKSSSSLVIEHSTIQYNTASGNGGGIYSNHNNSKSSNSLVIEHSTIQYNTASGWGGGIYSSHDNSKSSYSLVIEHSTIQYNTASGNGGGIYSNSLEIESSTINNNTASGDGGGICGSSLKIKKSTIQENTANLGGGIYGSGVIEDSTIKNNTVNEEGGVIYSIEGSLKIKESTIEYNNGGGIYSYSDSSSNSLEIEGSTIQNNKGIGIYSYSGVKKSQSSSYNSLKIKESIIQNNDKIGIYSYSYCNYTDSSSNNDKSSSTNSLEIEGRSIIQNNKGGGIYSSSYSDRSSNKKSHYGSNSSSNSLKIENSIIQGNTTSGDGGGIYIDSNSKNINGREYEKDTKISSSNSLEIKSSIIQENIASGHGGGIYISSNSKNSDDRKHNSNIKISSSNSLEIESLIIQGNIASGHGGGIYSSSSQDGYESSSSNSLVIINNNNSDLGSLIIKENKASSGGAIYAIGSTITITDGHFKDNEAVNDGGGIYSDGSPTITDSYFLNNQANHGGAICSLSPTIMKTRFEANRAYLGGGVKLLEYLKIQECSFYNNVAYRGGGIYGSGNIDQCIFQYNQASHGGGIYSSDCSINDSRFHRNTGQYGSGIFSIRDTNLNISHCVFHHNNAIRGKGSVLLDNPNIIQDVKNSDKGEVTILGSLFYSNGEAHIGLIQDKETRRLSIISCTFYNSPKIVLSDNETRYILLENSIVTDRSLIGSSVFLYQEADFHYFRPTKDASILAKGHRNSYDKQKKEDENITFKDLDGNELNLEKIDIGAYQYNEEQTDIVKIGQPSNPNKTFTLDDILHLPHNVKEIHLQAGDYYPTIHEDDIFVKNALLYISQNITIKGGYDETFENVEGKSTIHGTTQDGKHSVNHIIYLDATTKDSNITNDCHFENLVFQSGKANGDTLEHQSGAAIYLNGEGKANECSPTIRGCDFKDNTATYGGALFANGKNQGKSQPKLENCDFTNNIAQKQGGAVYASGYRGSASIQYKNCNFEMNQYSQVAIDNPSTDENTTFDNCQFLQSDLSIGIVRSAKQHQVDFMDTSTSSDAMLCNDTRAIIQVKS